MARHWRWAVVAAVTIALIALPLAAQLLPAGSSAISAAQLLARVKSSGTVGYSGYAQSEGGLTVPIDTRGVSLGTLLSGITQTRVWWRGVADWRVDAVSAAGEVDLHRAGTTLWTWNYEANTAEVTDTTRTVAARLPRTDDLVPANLARRLLSQTTASEVRRLPNARIAGQQAAGLRMTVTDPRSTIGRVDVWAVPSDGLPLRVTTYTRHGGKVVTASMLDVSLRTPPAAATRFRPAPGARVSDNQFGDVVSAINTFGSGTPPKTLAGLPRVGTDLGAVGEYGRGVTQLIAIPLPFRFTDDVVAQIRAAPGATDDSSGIAVGSGPVNLRVSPPGEFGRRWLLVGTVTAKTLLAALPSLPPVEGFGFGR